MTSKLKTIGTIISALIIIAAGLFFTLGASYQERQMNTVVPHAPYRVTTRARSLHSSLNIMDWHSDSLLWDRDILDRVGYSHVDVPRLQDGNIAIQMFTTVTKVPSNLNYVENSSDSDQITPLAVASRWPIKAWSSIKERALYQAEKLEQFTSNSMGQLVFIKTKSDLENLMQARKNGKNNVGALLGAEGAHPLEGRLLNIDELYKAGFRMIGLTHFFDNALAGSLHGTSKAGLSKFGRTAVKRLHKKGIIIDLAHASEKAAWEVLEMTDGPLVVSHTGLKGTCDSPRNFPDDLMKAIAAKGGLIAVGAWEEVLCDTTPASIAKTIRYGIDLVGADHISLGSDWDGAIQAVLTPDELPILTQALMSAGVSNADIRKVMGDNSIQYLQKWLPDS